MFSKKLCVFKQIKKFLWKNSVTYGTPCHASGHLVTASATDLRLFFTLRRFFYFTLLPASFKVSLRACSPTTKLTGFHADLRNIAPARLFAWITAIHKRLIMVDFIYRSWLAGWGRICLLRDFNSFCNRFVCKTAHVLSAWPQSSTVYDILRLSSVF